MKMLQVVSVLLLFFGLFCELGKPDVQRSNRWITGFIVMILINFLSFALSP